MRYTEFTIKKKNGTARKIVSPDKELLDYQQNALKAMLHDYLDLVKGTKIQNTAHGFIRGRNVVSAAKQHIGYKATIMMDISAFFDSVYQHMLPERLQDPLFYHKDLYCAQGMATSPMLANIASVEMLKNIEEALSKRLTDFAFTIYADDIQVSLNDTSQETLVEIIRLVTAGIEEANFKVNAAKTRIKFAKYGYRRILGINVGDTDIRATRKTMRKIRAARHQSKRSSLGGLINWSNCNPPNKPQ